jgi:hypothetical protein
VIRQTPDHTGRSEVAAIASAWASEYASGRYRGESQLPFVLDIVKAARGFGLTHGIYVGCGNGRNYVPLREAGLMLLGLDISSVALELLAATRPEYRSDLVVGELGTIAAPGVSFDLIVGIQVFQHGTAAQTHRAIAAAQAMLAVGGLLCMRVNAVDTDVYHRHTVTESCDGGGYTVVYSEGPKRGLPIHFFGRTELESMFDSNHSVILAPRAASTQRAAPKTGSWTQWEAIWRRTQ